MKKFLLVFAITTLFCNAAFADFQGPVAYPANQGFQGGGYATANKISTVKDVMNMYDDQIAVIKGTIKSRISDDKYLFSDGTGEMVVEIDYKYWAGIQVTEKDVLELTGKVDREYSGVTLDVFVVKKAN